MLKSFDLITFFKLIILIIYTILHLMHESGYFEITTCHIIHFDY